MIEIILAIFGLLLSAFFTSYEIAYVVREKSTIAAKYYGEIRAFLLDPHRVITTVLIGTNLSNVLVAVTLTEFLSQRFPENVAVLYAGSIATISVLILGEILPKVVGRANPEIIFKYLTGPLYRFYIGVKWLIVPFDLLLTRPLRKRYKKDIIRDIEEIIWRGHKIKGDISRQEFLVLSKLLTLLEKRAKDIMIPIRDIYALPEDTPIADVLKEPKAIAEEKFPIFAEKFDNITGIVHIKDLFGYEGKKATLKKFKREIGFVYDEWDLEKVLNHMREKSVAHAVVVDEFGNCVGLIALEKLIKELVYV